MSLEDNQHYYVATYKEIFIGFIAFILILIVLYPKELLHKQILSENANYDLSMLYLQNMLANDPTNEQLMLNLAQQSLRGNKRDLAYRLLKLLKKSKKTDIRQKAYQLSYEIAKEDYFYLLHDKKNGEAEKLFQELQALNRYIILKHYYKQDNLAELYKEAVFAKNDTLAYNILKQLLQKEPYNIKYIEDIYYLALNLHKYTEALHYSEQLSRYDIANTKKWKEAEYFILYKYISKKKAEDFLMQEAKHSLLWLERLAQLQLGQKFYKASSHSYMQLFQRSKNYNKKVHYWLMAMKVLQQGNYLKEATKIGRKYQKKFLQNREVRIYLLKLYLANNDAKSADNLAKQILKLKLKR
jgi:hypothetical protein